MVLCTTDGAFKDYNHHLTISVGSNLSNAMVKGSSINNVQISKTIKATSGGISGIQNECRSEGITGI